MVKVDGYKTEMTSGTHFAQSFITPNIINSETETASPANFDHSKRDQW